MDRVNWSTLKSIGISPKHYLHVLATPRTDTEAMQLGRLTHCALFEPQTFCERYVVSPNFHRGMNDETAISKGYAGGKQAAVAWDLIARDKEVVAEEMWSSAKSMRDAILADPVASAFIVGGHQEQHIEWTDTETGIECRGRVDHVNGHLSDLKTSRSLVTCERDAARFGYHAQIAWYWDGLQASGVDVADEPALVFVESTPPWDTLVLTFNEEDLAMGRRVYRRHLDRLAECRRTGNWPGMSNGFARRIELPTWADPVEEVELTMDGVAI